MLTDNMVKGKIRAFAFPLKPFSYDNVVLALLSLRPYAVSKVAYLVNLTMC
jgi:hypothetical protein